MKTLKFTFGLVLVAVLLVGCDSGGSNYPVAEGGWFLDLNVGWYPGDIQDYPVFITTDAKLVNLDNGDKAPDGTIILFRVSDGSFENGLPEIGRATMDGKAVATLQIDHPGTYEMTVEVPQQDLTSISTFTVGF